MDTLIHFLPQILAVTIDISEAASTAIIIVSFMIFIVVMNLKN